MEPLQTFVNNGITLLDKEMGPRWPLEFKGHLARMNMEQCNRCALGVLFGEYDSGLDKICPVVLPADLQQYRSNISKICAVRVSRNPWAALHGFTLWNYKSIEDDVWKTLTDLWKKEISSRIEAIEKQDNDKAHAVEIDLAERVEQGAAMLDTMLGLDWPLKFENRLPELRLIHCEKCVLGILFGDYQDGKTELLLDTVQETADHGFTFSPDEQDDFHLTNRPVPWKELTLLWTDKITELIQQRKEENNAITNTIFAEPHGENRRPKTEAELQGRVCSTR